MKYVMSDVHGMLGMLQTMLERIGFGLEDTLYYLGDAIDRGPDSIATLQYLMRIPNVVFLIGNHEDNLLRMVQHKTAAGYPALLDYEKKTMAQFEKLSEGEQREIVDFLKGRPRYLVVDDWILVHAGIMVRDHNRELPLDELLPIQRKDILLSGRVECYHHQAVEGKTVVFGHTPTYLIINPHRSPKGALKIWNDPVFHDKIGIDCGAMFSTLNLPGGRLACLCLDNGREYYVEESDVQAWRDACG